MEYKYSELAIGGVNKRGTVVDGKTIKERLNQNGTAGCYRSHFKFTKDFQDYVTRTGSVSAYKGPCATDFFWLDIDHWDDSLTLLENLAAAMDIAQTFMNRLLHEYEIPPLHLRCFFSGKKGFHIGIPAPVFGLTPSKELPSVCKALAVSLAGDLDYDPGIYDKTRLFRLNNTKHEGSGLYKVELHPDKLLTCIDAQEIINAAKAPRNLGREYDPEDSYGTLTHLINAETDEEPTNEPEKQKSKEKWLADLLDNGAKSPGRNDAIMRLGGYYSSKGIPEDVAFSLITSWDIAKNDPPLTGDPNYPVDKIRTSVANAYKYPREEDEVTLETQEEIQYENWRSIHDGTPEYIEKFSKNRLAFGFPQIDATSALLGRGEVANIIAYVGVGKTVLAQNLQMYAMDNHKAKSILFSLEMSSTRLYFRKLGMLWDRSSKQVEDIFKAGGGDDMISGMERYDDMYIVDHAPVSVPMMTEIITDAPVEIDLVLIDYVGLLSDPGTLEYERMTNLSRDIAIMAKNLNIAIIAVYQTNRTGADGEVRLESGRGSGNIEANCDIVLGMWDHENDDKLRYLKLLKARHGVKGVTELIGFKGDGPRLYPM